MRTVPLAAFLAFVLPTGCGGGDLGPSPAELADVGADDAPGSDAFVLPDAPRADAAEDADGAASDDAAVDAPDPGTVPVFVAQGYMGRTILSCDRGESWVGDRSDDDALRCFSGVDCDHNGGRAMGITFGAGTFAATWGWGEGNSIRRSDDGFTWEKVTEGTQFSGIQFAGERFVAISGTPRVSTDGAKSFTPSKSIGFVGHIRSTGASTFGGARFVAAGSENGAAVGEVMTSEDGVGWKRPKSVPSACGLAVGWNSIASGKDVTVIVSDDGTVCRSDDGGDTWTKHALGGTFDGTVLHDGARFVGFGSAGGKRVLFESADGKSWSSKPLTKAGGATGTPSIGAAAFGDGRFVAVNGGWNEWYEKQVFYRSDDGVAWTELPKSAFVGSHPIVRIAFGRVKKPSVCK